MVSSCIPHKVYGDLCKKGFRKLYLLKRVDSPSIRDTIVLNQEEEKPMLENQGMSYEISDSAVRLVTHT